MQKSRQRKQRRPQGWPDGVPVPTPGPFSENQRWTTDDYARLHRFYPLYGPHYCARLLGRTVNAVKVKANNIGITESRQWSPEEIKTLKEIYQSGIPWARRHASRALGRTEIAVITKARKLGYLFKRPERWTGKEEAFLKKHYRAKGPQQIAKELGKRYSQVLAMASKLGVSRRRKKVTQKDVAYILRNARRQSFQAMAKHLNLSSKTVTQIALEHGIARKGQPEPSAPKELRAKTSRNRMPWMPEEDEIVRKYYPENGARYTGQILGRSYKAVQARAEKLEVKFARTPSMTEEVSVRESRLRSEWIAEDIEILQKHYSTDGPRHTSILLGRTRKATAERARVMGIKYVGNRPWTEAERRRLISMKAKKIPHAEIATALDRTEHSVTKQLYLLRKKGEIA